MAAIIGGEQQLGVAIDHETNHALAAGIGGQFGDTRSFSSLTGASCVCDSSSAIGGQEIVQHYGSAGALSGS